MRSKTRLLIVFAPIGALAVAWAAASVVLHDRLEVKDWVPIVLSGLALIVALLTAAWSSFEQRRHLATGFAVTLWQKWSEAEMVAARNLAWDAIRSEAMRLGRKRIGRLRATATDQYRAIARVNHFLADLNDLVDAELLELGEVKALFRDTLQAYYCHLRFVDIGDAFTDGTGEAQQKWFESKVLGLAEKLALTRAGDFQRYQEVFEANCRASEQSIAQAGGA